MISSIISIASKVCCVLVLGSFVIFAYGQISGASKTQVAEINGAPPTASPTSPARRPNPIGAQPQPRVRHGEPRRFIEGAARLLTSPFRSFFTSQSQWSVEIATTVLALLLYGLGLGLLGRYARM